MELLSLFLFLLRRAVPGALRLARSGTAVRRRAARLETGRRTERGFFPPPRRSKSSKDSETCGLMRGSDDDQLLSSKEQKSSGRAFRSVNSTHGRSLLEESIAARTGGYRMNSGQGAAEADGPP